MFAFRRHHTGRASYRIYPTRAQEAFLRGHIDPFEEIGGIPTRSMLATRRKAAGFPTGNTFDTWDESASLIPVPTQRALRTLEWIGRKGNVVVCGPSGTGKTFLLEALGQQIVEGWMRVAWFRLEDLRALVRAHRSDDPVNRVVTRILLADLVVVDYIGLLEVGADAAEGPYRLLDAAYEKTLHRRFLEPAPGRLRRPHAQNPRNRDHRPSTPRRCADHGAERERSQEIPFVRRGPVELG